MSGTILIVLYNLFTAIQGVWLSSFLQNINVFIVLFFNFLITFFIFFFIQILKKNSIVGLYNRVGILNLLILNVITFVNWAAFFLSLKYIEPAVEAALTSALPPLLTAIFTRLSSDKYKITIKQMISTIGIFAGGFILVYASFIGDSAVGVRSTHDILLGVVMAVLCGASISIYTIFSKRLNVLGIKPDEIMVLRFPLLIIVSLLLAPLGMIGVEIRDHYSVIFLLPIIGVVLPLFFLQLGISRLTPVKVSILVTLTPIFFYIVELFDHRLQQTPLTLLGITVIAISIFLGIIPSFKNSSSRRMKRKAQADCSG